MFTTGVILNCVLLEEGNNLMPYARVSSDGGARYMVSLVNPKVTPYMGRLPIMLL